MLRGHSPVHVKGSVALSQLPDHHDSADHTHVTIAVDKKQTNHHAWNCKIKSLGELPQGGGG